MAEELLYFRISGLQKRSDLTLQQVVANPTLIAAINAYQLDNLLRLAEHLKAPETSSPYKDSEDLATRGATWQFLRYVVDLSPANENTYFRALVNAKTNGMANLTPVVAPLFAGGLPTAFRSWALAQYLDNSGLTTDPMLQFSSWNYRSVLTNQLGLTGYPLKPRILVEGAPQSFVLPAGGAGYMRFRVNGGASAAIVSSALPSAVDLVLVRTQ